MDLSITVNGIKFPNPFLLGSGPPGTNARVLAKSYDAGWGGAVAKTVSLESSKVVNVVPPSALLISVTRASRPWTTRKMRVQEEAGREAIDQSGV